jgi:hypothetical protein
MLTWHKYSGLCGSGCRSVIPYVNKDDCYIVVCDVQPRGLNLAKRVCLLMSSVQPFIIQGQAVTM